MYGPPLMNSQEFMWSIMETRETSALMEPGLSNTLTLSQELNCIILVYF